MRVPNAAMARRPDPPSLLVDDVAEIYGALPGVLGPEREATQFADQWTKRRGGTWTIRLRQRIHVLRNVESLSRTASGSLRTAESSDLTLVGKWMAGFMKETGIAVGQAQDLAERLVRESLLYLWEDAEPRSMVALAGETDHGMRIGYVYTPPEFRGRGCATTAVARLSRLQLESGRSFCCLYTDSANPTSNAIYAEIGYRPLCEVVEVNILE